LQTQWQVCSMCMCVALFSLQAVDFLDELPQHAVPQLNQFKSEELCFLLSGYGFARHFHRVRACSPPL
jgi:hypothetical protein